MTTATDKEAIKKAASLIQAGELVAFPTETVYGLGCDATNPAAIAKIFALKDRPSFNPLIVHFAQIEDIFEHAVTTPLAEKITQSNLWPGPLTVVLERKRGSTIAPLATAGLDTVAVRIPQHPVAKSLILASGCPIAAPSANRSGLLSPTQPAHVHLSFGDSSPFTLDGGPSSVGLESTVIDLSQDTPVLLRAGGLDTKVIEAIIGTTIASCHHNPHLPKSPGQTLRHYATLTPLRTHASYVRATEALLAFGRHEPHGAAHTVNLSFRGDLTEAAANFFSMLHELDQGGFEGIAVSPIPEQGLGIAINDRLRRAVASKI